MLLDGGIVRRQQDAVRGLDGKQRVALLNLELCQHLLRKDGTRGGADLPANRLRKELPDVAITVVDGDDRHVYQPGLLFVPFGLADPDRIVRPRHEQLHPGVVFHQCAIGRVDVDARRVQLTDGTTLDYDVLVVATGSRLVPEETDGLTGPGWMERVFTFYDLEGATALAPALERFEGGRVVVNVVDLPIKCPVAPLEFCFLADWYFHERGIRDRVELTYVTPLDGAFTKPTASATLGGMLEERGIELVTEFNTGEVDGNSGRLVGFDGREVPFDLAVVVPVHSGAAYVGESPGLGDALDFVVTDPHTLQSQAAPNIFAIGDAANLPASKAGSVTHFEGSVLVENIRRFLAGEALDGSFDGHTNCFIETGFHKAMLIDFNYDTEPVGGHFPDRRRDAAAQGVPPQPPRQADVRVVLLARPPARPRPPRAHQRHARQPASTSPARPTERTRADRTTGEPIMPTATLDGVAVAVNDEGFFEHPDDWNEAMAVELARAEGIDPLTDRHWQVIRFMRAEYAAKGTGPTVRVLGKTSGVSVKELYQLFPKGPAKTAAKIAGIPKPRGCI